MDTATRMGMDADQSAAPGVAATPESGAVDEAIDPMDELAAMIARGAASECGGG